jgi:hypothetical protein
MSDLIDNSNEDKKGQNPTPEATTKTEDPKPTVQERNFEALRIKSEKLEKELAKANKLRDDEETKKLEADGKLQELLNKERKEKDDLLSKYQNQARSSQLERELQKSGINSELIDMILPSLQSKVEFSDDNRPTNFDQIINDLKTTKPSLFLDPKSQNVQAGKVGAGITNNGETAMTQEQALEILSRNNYDEIAKYDKEIKQALS